VPPKPYRIGVISDTHGYLHPDVFSIFEGVDLILHAGDVGGVDVLTELEAIASVQAICGNVDGPPDARLRPLTRELETPAGRIAMVHGHLPQAPSTNLEMVVDFFKGFQPQIIIYGHSHIPKLEQLDGVLLFNPGSAGQSRFGHGLSVGLITKNLAGKPVLEHRTLKRDGVYRVGVQK